MARKAAQYIKDDKLRALVTDKVFGLVYDANVPPGITPADHMRAQLAEFKTYCLTHNAKQYHDYFEKQWCAYNKQGVRRGFNRVCAPWVGPSASLGCQTLSVEACAARRKVGHHSPPGPQDGRPERHAGG